MRISAWLIGLIAVILTAASGAAISAQDKYTVQVPDGLAFSEFKGYEDWQVIAVSQTEELLVPILGNPEISRPTRPAFPATASLSPTAPRWRRSIGQRRRARRPRLRRRCRTPCMTLISW